MSVIRFTLELAGDVSSFTPSVQFQIKNATAALAGVDPSAVELTISPGSVIVGVRILTPTATATSVQSTMAIATSSPSSATAMLASVPGVSIAVLAVVTPPTIASVAPPPPPLLIGALAVAAETSGSIGIIIGVIVGVIIALVLALVFTRRRRHLNEKRRKNISLQVPNGQEAQLDEKETATRKANAESADEMAAPVVPRPTGATKAPKPTGTGSKAPKLRLAVEEGFELQNTPIIDLQSISGRAPVELQNKPIVPSILQTFSPMPEGFQHVFSSFRAATSRADVGDLNA
jgi:hypothetical protein